MYNLQPETIEKIEADARIQEMEENNERRGDTDE